MTTNYYLWPSSSTCSFCAIFSEPLHIGLDSWGWCFALHIYPEKGIHDLADWKKLLEKENFQIFDEYAEVIDKFDFFRLVEGKNRSRKHLKEIYHRNETKNISNGKGYWDCLDMDFS